MICYGIIKVTKCYYFIAAVSVSNVLSVSKHFVLCF